MVCASHRQRGLGVNAWPRTGLRLSHFLTCSCRDTHPGQLAEAVPETITTATGERVPSCTLPLDLRAISSRCNGAYYGPRRFAAVQLAFAQPRSRVLLFRTPCGVLEHTPKRKMNPRGRVSAPVLGLVVHRYWKARGDGVREPCCGAPRHHAGKAAASTRGRCAPAHPIL